MTRAEALVVDASALLAVLLPEPNSAEARERLGGAMELHAPDLLLFETTAVLAARVAREDLSAEDAESRRREACDFSIVPVPARELSEQAFALAERLNHSAYDCFYLALAIERDCPMLTGDAGLAAAARRAGLDSYVSLLGSGPASSTSGDA